MKDAAAVEDCQAGALLEAGEAAQARELLGFMVMNGQRPETHWAKIREAREWLVGMLAPDGWGGLTFVADHVDIFAFRLVAVPAAWRDSKATDAAGALKHCVANFEKWVKEGPKWWRRPGPMAPDRSYARTECAMPDGGPTVVFEWARTGKNQAVARVTLSDEADIVVQAYCPWSFGRVAHVNYYAQTKDQRGVRGLAYVPGTRDGMRWTLTTDATAEACTEAGNPQWYGLWRGKKKMYLVGQQGQRQEAIGAATAAWDGAKIDAVLSAARAKYEATRPEGAGALADATTAINDQLQFSEVYTPERKRPYISVSRSWAQTNNSAPDFLWDSFLNAVLVAQEDAPRAYAMLSDILSWQNEAGMLAQYGAWFPQHGIFAHPVAWGHTQYPIGSLAVAKVFLRHPDREALADFYPRLLKAHKWWFADRGDGQPWRDGNKNGLLELGANYPEEIDDIYRQQVASFESHDDSPQWQKHVRYNPQTQTLEIDTVERNCLYALDAWVLAWMAQQLGYADDAKALTAEHAEMAQRINTLLWVEGDGCYFNRAWAPLANGKMHYPHQGPDIFLSLLGKVAGARQAESLRKIFHDPTKFAGEFLIPTIARDDPAFKDQHYWRGKVWAPINWLVYQGFRIYGWEREAALLAESGRKMFLKPWRERGECFENFLSTTGEGSSDPHYTWGALLAQVGVEELIDVSPWHGLRLGTQFATEEAAVKRYRAAGMMIDVAIGPKLFSATIDGKVLAEADGPVELRHVRLADGKVRGEAHAATERRVVIAGQTLAVSGGAAKVFEMAWPAPMRGAGGMR